MKLMHSQSLSQTKRSAPFRQQKNAGNVLGYLGDGNNDASALHGQFLLDYPLAFGSLGLVVELVFSIVIMYILVRRGIVSMYL